MTLGTERGVPSATKMAELTDAAHLTGMELDDGWEVVERMKLREGSGGTFSTQYIVRRDGKDAFLKALDFARVLRGEDAVDKTQALTSAFKFERDLLLECTEANLNRVVRLLGHGEIPANSLPGSVPVPYLILEKAEGDVRRYLSGLSRDIDVAFALRALHHISVGLVQMHSKGIAHHDIKPSNILYFGGEEGSKIGDVGSASRRNAGPDEDAAQWGGAQSYRPPEYHYGEVSSDWETRYRACDLYLLGSMATYFMMDIGMTPLLLSYLEEPHQPGVWGGTYANVLPHLQHAFSEALRTVHDNTPSDLQDELTESIRQQCEPNPTKRGHPKNMIGVGSQYSVVRYRTLYDRLAKSAEVSLRSGRSA